MRYFILFGAFFFAACSGVVLPPSSDSGPQLYGDAGPPDSWVPLADAGRSHVCAGYWDAVHARGVEIFCEPNFRCPCESRPIPDSCFNRLAGAFTCDQLDAVLMDCGALDDSSPVCP